MQWACFVCCLYVLYVRFVGFLFLVVCWFVVVSGFVLESVVLSFVRLDSAKVWLEKNYLACACTCVDFVSARHRRQATAKLFVFCIKSSP